MLATVAAMQGRIAMWHLLGDAVKPLDQEEVSSNVFTDPEIATVGWSQKARSTPVRSTPCPCTLPLVRNARAKMQGIRDGFVKTLSRPGTGIVVGGFVVAPRASELIYPLALAVDLADRRPGRHRVHGLPVAVGLGRRGSSAAAPGLRVRGGLDPADTAAGEAAERVTHPVEVGLVHDVLRYAVERTRPERLGQEAACVVLGVPRHPAVADPHQAHLRLLPGGPPQQVVPADRDLTLDPAPRRPCDVVDGGAVLQMKKHASRPGGRSTPSRRASAQASR